MRRRFETDAGDVFRRAMLESAIGMCIVDRDGRFVEVNPALCEFFGMSADDLVARTWQELTHPDDVAVDLAQVERVLAGTVSHYRLPKRYLHADGHVLYGDLAVSGIRDPDGTFRYFVSQIVDETERLTLEQRLGRFVRLARDIILLLDPSGRIVEANDAAIAAYGYTPDEIRHLTIADLRDPETLPLLAEDLARAERPEGSLFETVHRRSDGTTFPVEVSAHVVEIDGVPFHQSIVRDISERLAARRAADRARAELVEAQRVAHVGSWTWDPATDAVSWSDEMFRIYGLTPAEAAPTAMEQSRWTDPEAYARASAAADQAVRNGLPYEIDYDIVPADGVRRHVLVRGEAARDDRGAIVGLRGTLADVTASHEAALELRARTWELEEARALAGLGTWRRDLRTDAVSWSLQLYRTYGADPSGPAYTADEIDALLTPDSLAGREAAIVEAVRTGLPAEYEVEIHRRDGETRWLLQRIVVERDDAGEVIAYRGTAVDISEVRRAEAALAESEQRYRILAENAADVVFRGTNDGRLTWISDAVTPLTGLSPADLVGRDFIELVHPDDAPVVHEVRTAVLAGESRRMEVRVRTADGGWRAVSILLRPVFDASGAVVGRAGGWHDIQAEVAAREALRASEAHLRAITETALEAIVTASDDGIITDWNAGAAAMFGYTAEEAVGMPVALVLPEPEVGPHAVAMGRFRASPERRMIGRTVELEARRRDGTLFPVELSLSEWTGAEGHFATAIIRDITARRTAETRLREREAELHEAQRLAHVGSWRWDPVADVVEWTDELFRIFGLDPAPTAPSLAAQQERFSPESRARLNADIERTIASGDPYETPVDIVRPDGEVRHAIAHGELVPGTGGALRLRGTLADVTEQRAMEARLAESLRLEAVGRLAGGVAHDFNNALMAINGTAELLAADLPEDDPMRIDLDAIRESGRRAAVLAKQLQAFGRRQTLRPTEIDLRAFLRETAPLLRRTLGPDVEVRTETPEAGPVVLVDRTRLDEVLLALSLNARDSMPGGGTVTLGARTAEVTAAMAGSRPGLKPGSYGCLSITDSGAAIEPDVLKHMFEPFYSTNQMGRGSGLGLATVQGIVAQSSGWIEATSGAGDGTTFVVYLPLAAPQPRGRHEADRARALPGATARIMLVDDEPSVRAGISRMLRRLGHAVREAADAREAVELSDADLASLDVVVSDVLMPGMDGGAMARRLRERRPGLPVLFVSGFAPDEALQRQLEEPRTAFLAKPFDLDTLDAAVRSLIPEAAATRAPTGREAERG